MLSKQSLNSNVPRCPGVSFGDPKFRQAIEVLGFAQESEKRGYGILGYLWPISNQFLGF